MKQDPLQVDAVVVGGGIAGMESALDLADQGFQVAMVEKTPSIGGKMIALSKVFPTLDCSSCITTPKMAACVHHQNITIFTYTDVKSIEKDNDQFVVEVVHKPRYVDEHTCTGCRKCEYDCPVYLTHEFEGRLGARKAIYIPFANAIPQIALRDVENCAGHAQCQLACPAGVDAKGYIALVARGQYKEALEVIRKSIPFAGVCGRVCTHPCEEYCQRNSIDEPVAIRSLKRFVADYESRVGRDKVIPVERTKESRVAIIGSGPAGIACAYDLIQNGYPVTVFEAASEAGGLLRYGIPEYKLPNRIVDEEIGYVQEMGVEIKTNSPVTNTDSLFKEGYKAIFLATGAGTSQIMGITGEDSEAVLHALDFLKKANSGEQVKLGKKVAVVGGGNAAIDAARMANRLGDCEVTIVYRRSRVEMPAANEEIEAAEEEGININILSNPVKVLEQNGKVNGIECVRMELGEPDENGRRRPVPVEGSEYTFEVDNVIMAIGQSIDKEHLPRNLEYTQWGTIAVDSITMQTNIEGIFAGGDVVSGPADIITAIKSGKQAAISIHRYLEGIDLRKARPTIIEPSYEIQGVEAEKKARSIMPMLEHRERSVSFSEVELGFDEEMVIEEANRCLDCLCGNCERVCPANAINFFQEPREMVINARGIIVATGFELTPANAKKEYGADNVPNVLDPLQVERLLAPHGPYGRVLRPSDGKVPDSIAYVQCAGSRDKSIGVPYCSRVCCMYAIKQAMLLSGSLPLADITIYYMDIRAFGKGYEEFYQNAKAMGIEFMKGKVARITEGENQSPIVRAELIEEGGRVAERQYDMVVLSLGMLPAWSPNEHAPFAIEQDGFIHCPEPHISPSLTSCDGFFVAGTAAGPSDIVDSIIKGGSAAMEASKYLSAKAQAYATVPDVK